MKRTPSSFVDSKLIRGVLAFCLFSVAGHLNGAELAAASAKTRNVRGEARYKTEVGGKWKPLVLGTKLTPGAVIETGKASQVDLFLADIGSVIRMTESTQLSLDTLAFAKTNEDRLIEVELDLKVGTIMGNLLNRVSVSGSKVAAGSKYEVKIPNGKCAIHGTEFKISASGVVFVLSSVVTVTYNFPGGKTFTRDVEAGQIFYPPKEKGEEPKIELMPEPDGVLVHPSDPGIVPPSPWFNEKPEPTTKPPSKPANR